jgi:hypothetical protein
VLSADQLPTLWDPEELFSHLALWAGVPAVAVAVVVGVLGLYQSAKGWVDFAGAIAQGGKAGRDRFRDVTSERQRAAARLGACSVLAVGFSYMLAVIINAVVQVGEVNPNALFSAKVVENAVVVTQWSPAAVWTVIVGVVGIGLLGIACIADLIGLRKLISFLGGLACAVAWVAGVLLGADAIIGFALRGLSSQDPPPMSLLVTEVITAVLLLVLGLLLPKIRRASGVAFNSR